MDAYRDKNISAYPHLRTPRAFWIWTGSRVDTHSNRYPNYATNKGGLP